MRSSQWNSAKPDPGAQVGPRILNILSDVWGRFWLIKQFENIRNYVKKPERIFKTAFIEQLATRLPGGIFSDQKLTLGQILEDLKMENVGIFYGRLDYFMFIW
jgi:hypothetical protein